MYIYFTTAVYLKKKKKDGREGAYYVRRSSPDSLTNLGLGYKECCSVLLPGCLPFLSFFSISTFLFFCRDPPLDCWPPPSFSAKKGRESQRAAVLFSAQPASSDCRRVHSITLFLRCHSSSQVLHSRNVAPPRPLCSLHPRGSGSSHCSLSSSLPLPRLFPPVTVSPVCVRPVSGGL